jgi:uncharacterized Zn finger protein
MFDTQEIYLSRLEQYKSSNPPCPHCGSELTALKVIISERGTGRRTHECLKCGRDFSISVMADDDEIPF